MSQNSEQRPATRVIDPLTAAGALLALIAITALLTYAALTLPGKIRAAGGPPDRFRAAATQQAAQSLAASDTPAPTATFQLEETTELLPAPTNDAPTSQPASTNQSASFNAPPTATANPYGDWPLLNSDADFWLSIPSIHLEAPVVAFSPREKELEGGITVMRLPVPNSFSVSWDARSAEPGNVGNMVLSGHSNAYGGVFGDLDELAIGHEVAVWSQLGVFSYYVSSIQFVEEKDQPLEVRYENAQIWLGPSSDSRVTLITCWPESDSSQRLIVVATR